MMPPATIETDFRADAGVPAPWLGRLVAWANSPAYLALADVLIVLAAAALPWSTTLPAIFVALWLPVVAPTIQWRELARQLAQPAFAFPLLLLALAIIGTLWSEVPWAARLRGITPAAKFWVIPFLLHQFRRSQRGVLVLIAFAISCSLLMILSWIVMFDPAFKITRTVSDGVPVKNYIDQSQEFALCAFALALPALTLLRSRRWLAAIGCLALITAFIADLLFVVSARTALLYMAVLLLLFASLHLSRRGMLALFVAVAVAAALVWNTSPYLRQRIADIAVEYQSYEKNTLASTAQRLNYWNKSIRFFAEAPLLGHGTGSIRQLFERDAAGQTGLRGEVVNNPHNQTLNVAVQWGFLGVILLYAMWLSHLRLFAESGLAAWIGLVVVTQNVVSSLLNSHLFDFHEGWIYVLGVGVAGGMRLRQLRTSEPG